MDRLTSAISGNLRRLREERRLSLDTVARLSGVSKSMLGQIERGEVNPTVSTVWKISNGLKISFTQLLTRPESDIETVAKSEVQALLEDGGRFRNYPIFPFDSSRRFEMYLIELDGGGHLEATAHPQGTQEFITVFSGSIVVDVRGESRTMTAGDSIRFRADSPHAYENPGTAMCSLSMVIYYPQ